MFRSYTVIQAVYTASIAWPVMTVTAVTSGTISVGQAVKGPSVPHNTTIVAGGTGTGGVGTYNLASDYAPPAAHFTASISGYTMTVTGTPTGGPITVGETVVGAAAGTIIDGFKSGTGGTGTYHVSISQTLSSQACSLNILKNL